MNVLQISPSGAKLCDEHGDSAGIALAFSLGQHLTLEFDLRGAKSEDGILLPLETAELEQCPAFYFALGNVWNAASTPLLLRTSGITVETRNGKSILTVEIPDTGVASLVASLAGKSSAVFTCEIGGLDENALAVFVWQFQVTVCNRIYLGGDLPESVSGDPAYLTAAEVRALIGTGGVVSSDSIAFSGGTTVTANVKLYDESPIYVRYAGETFSGLDIRYDMGLTVVSSVGASYLTLLYDEKTIYGDVSTGKISAPAFAWNETFSGGSASIAVDEWTRYTGSCDHLTVRSIPESAQESEIVVTFSGTASAPGIDLPPGTKYVGELPVYEAGKSYLVNIRAGIAVVAGIKSVEAAQ